MVGHHGAVYTLVRRDDKLADDREQELVEKGTPVKTPFTHNTTALMVEAPAGPGLTSGLPMLGAGQKDVNHVHPAQQGSPPCSFSNEIRMGQVACSTDLLWCSVGGGTHPDRVRGRARRNPPSTTASTWRTTGPGNMGGVCMSF